MSEPRSLGAALAGIVGKIVVDQPDEPKPAIPLGPDGLPWCETCKGRRYVRKEVPVEDPDFGKAIRCPVCPAAVTTERRQELAQYSGMGIQHMTMTFDTFTVRPGTERAYESARKWSEAPAGWLVIHGTPDKLTKRQRLGQGKTHLACAVTNRLLDRLQPVHWWYAPDAVATYQNAMASHEHGEVLTTFQHAAILVLDDLGAARATENAVQQFLEPVFNYRERNRLPTLVTCIGDPESIKQHFSESIGRRFQDKALCRVVALDAPQYQP